MSQSYRLQLAAWNDSVDPKDACVINPCFKIVGTGGFSPQNLCDDLAAAANTKIANKGQIRVRAYELPYVRGAGHVAEKLINKGLAPASTYPREQALCLSYYSSENKPRKRGRLYFPIIWLGMGYGGVRPTSPMMTEALSWRTTFTGLGGLNVDWILWSERDNTDHPVTDVWCDDEHDTVRSRGLRPTTRITATTSEADLPNLLALTAPGNITLEGASSPT